MNNGLAANHINSVSQDSSGYLWLGTMSGFVRFNSSGFSNFRSPFNPPASLRQEDVQILLKDSEGALWL
ncbi:MAG: hypothetical protein MI784_03400, partial [Cytophagales bacterium]|nr:hypothetical protein [Cytophagales bacterium]